MVDDLICGDSLAKDQVGLRRLHERYLHRRRRASLLALRVKNPGVRYLAKGRAFAKSSWQVASFVGTAYPATGYAESSRGSIAVQVPLSTEVRCTHCRMAVCDGSRLTNVRKAKTNGRIRDTGTRSMTPAGCQICTFGERYRAAVVNSAWLRRNRAEQSLYGYKTHTDTEDQQARERDKKRTFKRD